MSREICVVCGAQSKHHSWVYGLHVLQGVFCFQKHPDERAVLYDRLVLLEKAERALINRDTKDEDV